DLAALAGIYAAADAETRGEIAIVIAPPPKQETDAADLDALLRDALDRLSVKEAVTEIAAVTGHPRRAVYQRALALAQDHGEHPQCRTPVTRRAPDRSSLNRGQSARSRFGSASRPRAGRRHS